MTPENTHMDPALERAAAEIRDEHIPDEVIDAAAARVWARLSEPGDHIRHCTDFQALFPEFRAGRLAEARTLLVQDHLHECVACRHVFEGKVTSLPVRAPVRKAHPAARWAMAAGVVVAGGLVVWFSIVQLGTGSGRAVVQSVNGTLFEVSPAGLRMMAVGEALPDGVEIRTARDSGATLALRDGSVVEMRERSDFSTSRSGGETTVRLGHGSIIVQAAKRRSGHLYVATADCRIAVTGTLFSVSAGVKGSRVSVIEGEVHITHDNQERVLHPGDQDSTSDTLEPAAFHEDFAWSRNAGLQAQLAALREDLGRLHMPQMRYSSRLLGLLPASTVFFASIPNLSQYLSEAQNVFRRKAAESPELGAWLAGPGASIEPVLEKLRTANEYLGEEIAIFGTESSGAPIFLAKTRREGFPEFLKKAGLPPLAFETRAGLILFSPRREALAAILDSSFQKTPFYARITEAYHQGAGLLLCADLARVAPQRTPSGMRYLIAEQKQTGEHIETRATIGFDGPRTGVTAWLAAPSPIGALDYVSPEATFVMAFAITSPAPILEQVPEMLPQHQGAEARREAAASLGSEFAFALDGPVFPVPSWKLVAEVYDPVRFQSALDKFVAEVNREAAAKGGKPLRTAQEKADGRTDYLIGAGEPNPLTQAYYTFSRGYLIAAPTHALLTRAFETQANGIGITRSANFTALIPRDHYTNFSGVVYQNLGSTLAPLAGLFAPKGAGNVGNLKPFLIAAYGEPDQVAVAGAGDVLGMSLDHLLSGSLFNMATNALPWAQVLGTTGARPSSR